MQTLTKTLVIGALLALGLAQQNPWTNWGIYADSTGNGQNPVHGTLQCPDTFWLVVDTTGMGAAGITGWRWRDASPVPNNVVFAPSLGSSVPTTFPAAGLTDRKVGITHRTAGRIDIALITYFSNGDSVGIIRSVLIKRAFPSTFQTVGSVSSVCENDTVAFYIQVDGYADSFKVINMATMAQVLNQTSFGFRAPTNSGTWTIEARVYFCGDSVRSTLFLNVITPPPLPFASLSVQAQPFGICPGDSVTIVNATQTPPVGLRVDSIKVIDPSNSVVGTFSSFPFRWVADNSATPGWYDVRVFYSYPNGSCAGQKDSVSIRSFEVYGPSSLRTPFLSTPLNNYCPGNTATLDVFGRGLISIDANFDGIWDYVGTSTFSHVFAGPPPYTIRVKQDLGCQSRVDTLTWNPTPGLGLANIQILRTWCFGTSLSLYASCAGYDENAAGSSITWNIPWLSNPTITGPSTTITVPAPPVGYTGSLTITATFTNACGTRNASRTLSPSSFYASSFIVLGRVCVNTGGPVQIVYPSSTLADSIIYYLPDGTITGRYLPQDTFTYSLPAGVYGTTILAQVFYGSCSDFRTIPISATSTAARISPSSSFGVGVACPGATTNWFLTVPNTQKIRIYLGSTLIDSIDVTSTRVDYLLQTPNTPGSYTYTIVALGCGGNDTVTHTLTVTGSGAVANFTAPATACVGTPVTFQRTGTNQGIQSAEWLFGSGPVLYDTSLTVTHTYTAPGIYTVFLSLSSAGCGFTSYSRSIKVYGGPPSLSNFSVSTTDPAITYSVSATDYDSVKWDFGDGNTALGLSGSYTYTANGTYTVQAIAYNPCGNDTLKTTVTISSIPSSLASLSTGSWQLFPNPAHEAVTLTSSIHSGPVRVQMYDLHGRLVREVQIDATPGRLSVAGLPAGLYHLRLYTAKGTETLRLLVE